MNTLHDELMDIRDAKVRIQRMLMPLQQLEWFEPYKLSPDDKAQILLMRDQLQILDMQYKILKRQYNKEVMLCQ